MRTLLISLLLASAAATTPALAAPDDGDRHSGGQRQARSESRSEQPESTETRRSARSVDVHSSSGGDSGQGPSFHANADAVARADRRDLETIRAVQSEHMPSSARIERRESGGHPTFVNIEQGSGETRGALRRRVVENGAGGESAESTTDRRNFWRQRIREMNSGGADDSGPISRSGGLVQPERPLPRVLRTRVPVVSDTPREGTQPPLRTDTRTTSHHRWTGDWRHDHRYDWWNWRRRHHSHFHIGFYFDPFGWNYRRYDIGWRLWPAYYGSRFWIDDPWSYRLPYAPPGYRWIRYYDDLILVDTWDGRVVDVIYNFFW